MYIYHHTQLLHIIETHPELIPVLYRFDIKPGYGEKSVIDAADEVSAPLFTLLEVMNIHINNQYYPQRVDESVTISSIIEYIEKSNEYLINSQLYNISRHLSSLLSVDKMRRVLSLFDQFKRELEEQISSDRENEYKSLATLESSCSSLRKSGNILLEIADKNCSQRFEEMIGDIRKAMVMHMGGEMNINLFHAVVFSLQNIEGELRKLRRVKERLLYPLAEALTSIIEKQNIKSGGGEKPLLSDREREVLQLIASGKLNKEIASTLEISIYTVLTHRKNITAKLGIKSVSALTFYALTNGIISSDKIG